MTTRFTSDGLVHEHSDTCSHSISDLLPDGPKVIGGYPHAWRKIEYRDDVVPWHCMNCDTYNTNLWDEPCPNGKEQ